MAQVETAAPVMQQEDLSKPPNAEVSVQQQPAGSDGESVPQQDPIQENAEQVYFNQEEAPQMMQYKVKRRPKSTRKKVVVRRRAQQSQQQQMSAGEWNDRFHVTTSCNNNQLHGFFREYFDKKPKQFASSFRVKYANSSNELPGITDVGTRTHVKVKEFKSIPEHAYMNVKKVMHETRMPLKKG